MNFCAKNDYVVTLFPFALFEVLFVFNLLDFSPIKPLLTVDRYCF